MEPTKRLFISGTMRTGGSLVTNILSAHSDILVLFERVHFFRFIYKRYEPLTEASVARMLHHLNIRMRYRNQLDINVDEVLKAILDRGISYPTIYDELMKPFMRRANKSIWIENAAMHWDGIPVFLQFFDDAKTAHIIRDPRAVLASWKKLSSLPNNVYLNCLFNWLDSAQSMARYKETLSADRYLPLQYEQIHANPEEVVNKMCAFVGIEYEQDMVLGETWASKFDTSMVKIPRSAHEGNNITGFSLKRTRNWEKNLEEWEVCLTELLLGREMAALGYTPLKEKYSTETMRKGFDVLRESPFMSKQLVQYLASGRGTMNYPTDPTDPNSWGAPQNPSEWFMESPIANEYFNELDAVEDMLSKRYGY